MLFFHDSSAPSETSKIKPSSFTYCHGFVHNPGILLTHTCSYTYYSYRQTLTLLLPSKTYADTFCSRKKSHSIKGLIKLFITNMFGQNWFYCFTVKTPPTAISSKRTHHITKLLANP